MYRVCLMLIVLKTIRLNFLKRNPFIKYFHLLHNFKINFKRLTFSSSEVVHFAKHPREKGQHKLFISCPTIFFVSKGLTGLVSGLFEMRIIFSKVLANSWCD